MIEQQLVRKDDLPFVTFHTYVILYKYIYVCVFVLNMVLYQATKGYCAEKKIEKSWEDKCEE